MNKKVIKNWVEDGTLRLDMFKNLMFLHPKTKFCINTTNREFIEEVKEFLPNLDVEGTIETNTARAKTLNSYWKQNFDKYGIEKTVKYVKEHGIHSRRFGCAPMRVFGD